MMDKERFSEILRTTKLEGEHLDELDGLIREYPWFGLPRFIRLKAMEQLQQEPEKGELNKAAVFSSDRKQLYAWVTGQMDPLAQADGMVGPDIEFLEQDEVADEITSIDDPGTIEIETGGEVFELDEEEQVENDRDREDTTEQVGLGAMEGTAIEDDHSAVEGVDEEAGTEAAAEKEEPGNSDDISAGDDYGDEENVADEDLPEGNEEDADNKPIPEKTEIEMEDPEIEEPEAIPVIDPLDEEDTPSEEEEAAISEQGEDQPDQDNISMAELMEEGDSNPAEEDVEPEVETGRDQIDQSASHSDDLIERFLRNEPGVIKADLETKLEGDMSEGSVKEDDSFITDTLAKIYVKQGLHAKAIYAYERLSLKYPEKSAYFAAQIEKIKNNSNV